MEQAIARQPYSPDFSEYLLRQLRVPAERIRSAGRLPCQPRSANAVAEAVGPTQTTEGMPLQDGQRLA